MAKIRVTTLKKMKREQHKIAMLTTYDASFASVCNNAGVDVILVGDSVGMVVAGHDSTVPVTMDNMIYHTQCVARGNKNALIIGDMPYMSYHSVDVAIKNATAFMQAGAEMIKMEGGAWLCDSVKQMTERGIPVCVHLGLTPQSVHLIGGYKVQGKTQQAAQALMNDAKAMQSAGAQLLIVECIPMHVAKQLSEELDIPVVGIGAGPYCDGQVLVCYDMLGLNSGYIPKFVKNFMQGAHSIQAAIEAYVKEVKEQCFPGAEHSFSIDKNELSVA